MEEYVESVDTEDVEEYEHLIYYDEVTDDTIQIESPCVEMVTTNNDEDNCNKEAVNNELLNHVLILNENINENGEVVGSYQCQQCDIEFASIDAFIEAHSSVVSEEGDVYKEPSPADTPPFEPIDDLEHDKEYVFVVDEENRDYSNEDECSNKSKNAVEQSEDRYFCYDCQQVFIDVTTAEQHECVNSTKKTNIDVNDVRVCLYCQEVFSSNEELVSHFEQCGLKNKVTDTADCEPFINVFRCDICNKGFTTLRAFSRHKRSHKKNTTSTASVLPNVPAVCDICKTQFSSQKNLKLHMKIHNKPEVKSIQDALPSGAQNEYAEMDQFYCEICNKSFDQNLLTVHKNMHQNVEEYNCSKCNRKFENLLSFEMHLQMHSENRNVKNFIKKDNVPHGNERKKKFPCQYCGREFGRPYEKVKHERVHTGEKPYECEVCGKTFRVPYSLTLHLRTHTDIRPYVCPNCNKRFKSHSVYVHHLKTHNNERQYKCEMCSKSFRTSVQLCAHKNSHNKPFVCTECNRPFASLYAVKIHMNTHSKNHKSNKNLKNGCSICGASYTRIFALRHHLKQQHGIELDSSHSLEGQDKNKVNKKKAFHVNSNAGATDDFDETQAATQSILRKEEIAVETTHTE